MCRRLITPISKYRMLAAADQPTKDLTQGEDLSQKASRRPSVCLDIPALTAALNSITDTKTITRIVFTLTISRRD